MKYDKESFDYILSNGRRTWAPITYKPKEIDFAHYSKEERKEIAEYMIELWKEWAK